MLPSLRLGYAFITQLKRKRGCSKLLEKRGNVKGVQEETYQEGEPKTNYNPSHQPTFFFCVEFYFTPIKHTVNKNIQLVLILNLKVIFLFFYYKFLSDIL